MAIECPKCRAENPETARFCLDCGTRFGFPETPQISVTETLEKPREALSRGTLFAGRYEIIEALGIGGMGEVYRVEDKKVGQEIALKLIKPEIAANRRTIERFRQELKTARMISHRNVCRMFDLGEEKGTYFITMEYVAGEDLKSFLRRSKQLALGTAISITKQVCEGLAEAHRLGVVHRDLKPGNIMIDKEGNARIMDFGIAHSLKAKGVTGEGMIVGTPEYMSPEQVEGKDIDQRSDIYSLGVILYEMVIGRVPFEGETPLSVALKQKTELPGDPRKINPQIPEDLSRIILRCMEKEKEKRYQKVGEILEELGKIEKAMSVAEKILPLKKSLTSKEIPVGFWRRWKLIAGFILVGALAVAAILYFRPKTPALPPEKRKLVVLPFENLGPPEDEYFAEGIADEISARLAGIGQLGIIARNSAIQYKKTSKSIKQIGEELGVDYVMSGTIRWQKSGAGAGRVRVTPTLIRTSDSTTVFGNVYDETYAEIFQVQSDIAKKVVAALGIALVEPEKRSLEARPTENMQAYDYFLRGNDLYHRSGDTEEYTRLAIEMFEKAVGLDSRFLQAHANLSRMHSAYYWYHYDRSKERVTKAKEEADKALHLGPDAAEAHMALGYYYYYCQLDYDQALKHFAIGLEKQPKNVDIIFGIGAVKRRQGKMQESVANLILASEIDPRAAMIASDIGETYALMRRYQDAEQWYDRALTLNPDYQRTYAWKIRMCLNWEGNTKKAHQVVEEAAKFIIPENRFVQYHYVLMDIFDGNYQEALKRILSTPTEAYEGQFYFVPKAQLLAQIYGLMKNSQREKTYYDSARVLIEGKIKEDAEDSRFWSALGIALAGLGQKKEAIRAAEKAAEILPISKEAYRGTFRVKDLAQVYCMAGEYDKALDQIEYLLSIPGEISGASLKIDPVWIPLRSLPRFQKLLK